MAESMSRGDKRQHIVDTAYALFKRDGFHATGIDRIIAEAGVAKMTMYRHFPGKDGLIVAVLDHRAGRFEAQLDRLEEDGNASAAQKIARIFDWYARWFSAPDFHGCLFAHALAEFGDPASPVQEAAARQKNALKSRMAHILSERSPPAKADVLSEMLLMLLEGAALLAQMGQGASAIANAKAAAQNLLETWESRS